MKILTTLSYYRPHVSGLTICVQRLIEGLSKKDFEFTVLTSQYKKNLSKYEVDKKIKIIRSPVLTTLGKVPVMPWYAFQAFREIKDSDLVWIHLPQAEGLAILIVAKLLNKPVVSTVHCLPLLPSGLNRILFQSLFDWLNNVVIRFSDKVVYYTKDYAENTKELWHFPEKSEYILPPIPGVGSKEYGVSKIKKNKEMVVGFAGRIAEDKGIEYLVEAVRLLEEKGVRIKLLMAGSRNAVGENRYSKKIYSLIDESGVDVEFLGLIDPERMGSFYKLIDILILPSVNRTEAFGMVQAEAMKFGVPVISSNLPGMRIPVQLAKIGRIVMASNSFDLVAAIQAIRSAKYSGQSIARLAEKYFPTTDTLARYLSIIERQIET